MKNNDASTWLPISKEEIEKRGWDSVDVIIVSGDAYVDHPSFGHAMIARLVESQGFKVAILPQPNWRDDLRDFKKLGKPNFFFGVTSGCMDSMVNHYTSFKRLRSTDAYTPGDKSGFRPDYASIVYSKILKQIFPETPVVLGGVEASLRRFTHYDYWSDALKPSILAESGADLLVYGSGIMPLLTILEKLKNGNTNISEFTDIPQSAYLSDIIPTSFNNKKFITIPSHEQCQKNSVAFAESFVFVENESNKRVAEAIVQQVGNKFVVVNPPFLPMTAKELDFAYDLPYTRKPHPRYKKRGDIPAYEMIKHSVNTHVGCFGGCSFCSISMHQGKFISSRSEDSILNEVEKITTEENFKGYISDLGGPSANMYGMSGLEEKQCDVCKRISCIYPSKCNNLNDNHKPITHLYRKVRLMSGLKKAFVSSGLRYDMFINKPVDADKKNGYSEYFEELVTHHVSGRLKVAPEHTSDQVLKIMRKPSFQQYYKLKNKFELLSKKAGLKQEIIPYFISSHPGCGIEEMAACAADIKTTGIYPEQVQDLTPTPMTLSSVMYYTGIHPYTKKAVFVPKTVEEKRLQKLLFFWYKKENKKEIIQVLSKNNLKQLIPRLFNGNRSY